MSVEISSGGVNGNGIDPSNLHLKKELTQIRKAARVLRDPGTSSSWRSPISSVRSLAKDHYVHHHKNGKIDASEQFVQSNTSTNGNNEVSNKGNAKDKERKVFLYNWRSQKSESERSKQNGKEEGSFTTHDERVDLDSSSDASNNGGNGSKSDTYTSDRYGSSIFKCKDAGFTPSIRRTIKKKPKRNSYGSSTLKHRDEKLRKQIVLGRSKKTVPDFGLERDDLLRLVDQSDDTESYCNSENQRISAVSLLGKLRNKGWAHSPTKLLRVQKKEDGSVTCSTPALSTSSYRVRNPSVVESWDATTGSLNEADDEVDDHMDFLGQQGCGIPCYWSRRSTPKSGIGAEIYSPSLSDTLRRKGKSILCGSQYTHQRRHRKSSSLSSNKRRLTSSRAGIGQGLVPLLTNSSGNSDEDEIVNFGEIDLEALSRLDGKRWSTSCRSQEGLELAALNSEAHDDTSSPENVRSLSHKYRPMFFDELAGQNIVVQSLTSAVSRQRIAPVYLFQGPRGTGKTSMARIFAAALNCLSSEETKPCGVCRECTVYISGKSTCLREVDGSNKNGIEKVKSLLKSISAVQTSSAFPIFEVFVVKECHLLTSKTWQTFLRHLEKPFPHVVFILETTDADNVPRPVLSRCQKHLFNKLSNGDIVSKLKTIASEENLDVVSEALELIASNSDGSLRDAETMIDQLSLFGKRITISLVNELIGVVSDEKLLDLLELAMSSNATETVIKARELMGSGVDPIVLMSQMATLIVDIIAGTHPSVNSKNDSFFGSSNLSERELDRLKHALTLLSEAEKHIRNSSERSTWFTATLLQLGSMPSPDRTHSGSSRRQSSSKTTEEDHHNMRMLREATAHKLIRDSLLDVTDKSSLANINQNLNQGKHDDCKVEISSGRYMNSKMLSDVWSQCIEKCHSRTLRELLRSYGRLVSVSEVKGGFVAYIAFEDKNIISRAEGFLSSITNSFEIVLRCNVEVKLIFLPDSARLGLMNNNKATAHSHMDNSDHDLHHQLLPFDNSRAGNSNTGNMDNNPSKIPVQRIESIIREQRLETAWLQEMEKGTPGSGSRSRPERNQVLPQDGSYDITDLEQMQKWEDELNREIRALKISDGVKEQTTKRVDLDRYPMSPSLLHNNKDSMGYESGSGTGGCSCWNNTKPHRRAKKNQAKAGAALHQQRKSGRFSWFGECAKSRRSRPQILQ